MTPQDEIKFCNPCPAALISAAKGHLRQTLHQILPKIYTTNLTTMHYSSICHTLKFRCPSSIWIRSSIIVNRYVYCTLSAPVLLSWHWYDGSTHKIPSHCYFHHHSRHNLFFSMDSFISLLLPSLKSPRIQCRTPSSPQTVHPASSTVLQFHILPP